jgi:hypothetical protein
VLELTHLDEHGRVCTRHALASADELLSLAAIGARAPSFHHDLASKLQGLMMALDEIGELSGDAPPPLTRAVDTAHATLKEVLALLNANRALTKAPIPVRIAVAHLIARASDRVYVTVRGEIPAAEVTVAVPAITHAMALVLDVAGGPGRGRTVDVTTIVEDAAVVLSFSASSDPPPNAAESLALAGFMLGREHGALSCSANRLIVRLPETR